MCFNFANNILVKGITGRKLLLFYSYFIHVPKLSDASEDQISADTAQRINNIDNERKAAERVYICVWLIFEVEHLFDKDQWGNSIFKMFPKYIWFFF